MAGQLAGRLRPPLLVGALTKLFGDPKNLKSMQHEPENVTWSDYLLAILIVMIMGLGLGYAF
jgi:hypothetical protein